MDLNEKEYAAISDMLQTYRDLQEEIYDYANNDSVTEETLFTVTQRRLFARFDVVSVNYKKNR